jgi:protein-disulfide isomerase
MTQEAKFILGATIVTCILFVGAVFFLSQDKTSASNADINLLTADAKHSIFSSDAKVTITEFGDYQCPACARTSPVLKQLLTEYQGRVNFVYRHFPLPQHKNAISAINAAEAAGEQEKFWEMSDLLYQKQTSWSEPGNPRPVYIALARELGLDEVKFSLAIDSGKFQDIIQKDLQIARSLAVSGTPTIYINNSKFNLTPSYQNLKNQIESELKK